jgi:hypothetical protein
MLLQGKEETTSGMMASAARRGNDLPRKPTNAALPPHHWGGNEEIP